MNYNELIDEASTGDIFLVKDDNFLARLVRFFTGESISHVAIILKSSEALLVCEYLASGGYKISPILTWINYNYPLCESIFFGKFPQSNYNPESALKMKNLAYTFSGEKYSFLTFIKIWVAQVFRLKVDTEFVCSSFIQKIWEEGGGVKFDITPDPGDFFSKCEYVKKITLI
jgi:hypothetical protein